MAEAYHPGLEGVIAGETAVSSILDGLSYRGYSVEELATHATFEEVAYLMIHGELPTMQQLTAFQERLHHAAASVNPEIMHMLRSLPEHVEMMDAMRTGASMLAHW